MRRIVERILDQAGYVVMLAEDGQEAIDLADDYDGAIDLVVTDVVMPRVQGTQLAAHLSATRPETPVLFISGHTFDLPIHDRVDKDPDAFLAKPFTPADLLSRVRLLLDRSTSQVD